MLEGQYLYFTMTIMTIHDTAVFKGEIYSWTGCAKDKKMSV